MTAPSALDATKKWLEEMVIGHNLCPFAKKPLAKNQIHFHQTNTSKQKAALTELSEQIQFLEDTPAIETTLIILSEGFKDFYQYLDLVDYAMDWLADSGYEGVYQIASFHPEYLFEGEDIDSASHYTNRAPYPILHLLREDSLTRALESYSEPEKIPENNIAKMQAIGVQNLKELLMQYR